MVPASASHQPAPRSGNCRAVCELHHWARGCASHCRRRRRRCTAGSVGSAARELCNAMHSVRRAWVDPVDARMARQTVGRWPCHFRRCRRRCAIATFTWRLRSVRMTRQQTPCVQVCRSVKNFMRYSTCIATPPHCMPSGHCCRSACLHRHSRAAIQRTVDLYDELHDNR
jgi:hypothetical protein